MVDPRTPPSGKPLPEKSPTAKLDYKENSMTRADPIGSVSKLPAKMGAVAGFSGAAAEITDGTAIGMGAGGITAAAATTAGETAAAIAIPTALGLELAYLNDARNEINARNAVVEGSFRPSREYKNIRGEESRLRGTLGADGLVAKGFTLNENGQVAFSDPNNVKIMAGMLKDEQTRLEKSIATEKKPDKKDDMGMSLRIVKSAQEELPHYAAEAQAAHAALGAKSIGTRPTATGASNVTGRVPTPPGQNSK